MSRFVVDASVAIKTLITEDGSAEADSLFREHSLIAPDLIVPECANIIWKKVRRGQLSRESATLVGESLKNLNVGIYATLSLAPTAVSLAIRLDHPAYDLFYLALALIERCAFVTADETLSRKAAAPDLPQIRLLSTFAT